MSRKIYINWDNNEFYTTEEEVREAFENDDYAVHPDFEEFLYNNYTIKTVFDFNENDRNEARDAFEEEVQAVMKEWIKNNLTVINIDVIFKE